jgi:hypothetical protein
MVLAAMGVLTADDDSKSDTQQISSVTWAAIGSIGLDVLSVPFFGNIEMSPN